MKVSEFSFARVNAEIAILEGFEPINDSYLAHEGPSLVKVMSEIGTTISVDYVNQISQAWPLFKNYELDIDCRNRLVEVEDANNTYIAFSSDRFGYICTALLLILWVAGVLEGTITDWEAFTNDKA